MESIRVILRRNGPAADDIESQHTRAASTAQTASPRPAQQMEERSPSSRFLGSFPTFSRPAIPSFFGGRSRASEQAARSPPQPRPTSSYYTDDGVESPKTPAFSIGMPPLPSTRLHLPNLSRTWSQGSSGPPSRPATALPDEDDRPRWGPNYRSDSRSGPGTGPYPVVTEPVPAVPADHVRGHARTGSSRSQLSAPDPAEESLADLAHEGRERRRRHRHRHRDGSDRSERRRHRHREHRHHGEQSEHSSRHHRRHHRRQRDENRPTPKHFLFCFPWIPSRRVRSMILRCFVSGTFLTLLLTVYLSLSITKNINNSEFTILLILIILFTTIFFCHGLIRLCMLLVKPRHERDGDDRHGGSEATHAFAPGGYAIPRQPIRVVLARDEEAAGIESETTKINPPAYGLWRESVRVDPNRIYWQRAEQAGSGSATTTDEEVEDDGSDRGPGRRATMRGGAGSPALSEEEEEEEGSGTGGGGARRPPSYVSDDGVAYVVEAQPRSIAPTGDVPLALHPSEVGRTASPARW